MFEVDKDGYYGKFGGAYIPEMLYPNVEELRTKYLEIINSDDFKAEFKYLLEKYAGRPTPLFYANRLSDNTTRRSFETRRSLSYRRA